MPTYEYECDACHHAWERFQSIKAEPERVCPKCGKRKARRKIGVGAGILIGGRSEEPMGEPKSKNAGDGAKNAKTAAGAEGAKPATGAKDAKAAAKPATAAAPAASAPTEPTPASKATHPAREGRGVGNMLDALARARQQQEMRNQNRGPGSGNHGGKPGRPGQSKGGRSSAPRRSQGR